MILLFFFATKGQKMSESINRWRDTNTPREGPVCWKGCGDVGGGSWPWHSSVWVIVVGRAAATLHAVQRREKKGLCRQFCSRRRWWWVLGEGMGGRTVRTLFNTISASLALFYVWLEINGKKLHSHHNAGDVVSLALLNCCNYHLKMSITAT